METVLSLSHFLTFSLSHLRTFSPSHFLTFSIRLLDRRCAAFLFCGTAGTSERYTLLLVRAVFDNDLDVPERSVLAVVRRQISDRILGPQLARDLAGDPVE